MQLYFIVATLCKMNAIPRKTCLISFHSVHTWSQSGVDQSESIMKFYESVTHTPPTLPSLVRARVKLMQNEVLQTLGFLLHLSSRPLICHGVRTCGVGDLHDPVRENNQWCFVLHGGRFHLLKALPSATSREITHSVVNYLFSGSLVSIHVHREMAMLIPNKCALPG